MRTLAKPEGDEEKAQESNRRQRCGRNNGKWWKDHWLRVASVLSSFTTALGAVEGIQGQV